MSNNQLDRWVGRNQLSPDEIENNRFLKAASLFAGTAVQYGRDRYSGRDMPLFADCLHIDHLKAPRAMTSHRSGTEPKPAVWSFFQNQQNLMRLLASSKPVHWRWQVCPCCGRSRRIYVQPLLVSRKWRSALGWTRLCGLGNREYVRDERRCPRDRGCISVLGIAESRESGSR